MKCVCKKSYRAPWGTFKIGDTYDYEVLGKGYIIKMPYTLYVYYPDGTRQQFGSDRFYECQMGSHKFLLYFDLVSEEEEWEDISDDMTL